VLHRSAQIKPVIGGGQTTLMTIKGVVWSSLQKKISTLTSSVNFFNGIDYFFYFFFCLS